MAEFIYERKVNYYETDRMGIVHHSNYIRWMEEARLEVLEKIGIPYDKMEQDGILIPVLSASCEYHMAFRYGDTFRVVVYPLEFNGLKMKLGYKIYNKETEVLHSTGETGHCFVDSNMKLIRLKKEYPDYYNAFMTWYDNTEKL